MNKFQGQLIPLSESQKKNRNKNEYFQYALRELDSRSLLVVYY